MSPQPQLDVLARLRAGNPAAVEPDRGRSDLAQAALQRILDDQTATSGTISDRRGPRRNRGRSPRGLVIVLATLLFVGGAAFAATDPLGWWSANPGEARYGANPALHVRTPTIQQISCQAQPGGHFRCTAAQSGQRYSLLDAIRPPVSLNRAKFTAGIARALAAGKITRAQAAKFRADLAAVPDSFFRKFEVASRFGTYGTSGSLGNGRPSVPPPGIPAFLVCENAGSALSCQDLNGDTGAPIGAGVYAAEPTAKWRAAPPQRQNPSLPPGITFTPAEYRFLIDMAADATTSTSSSSSTSTPAQATSTAR